MYEPIDNRKIEGKCPYCGGTVLEFLGCYVCQGCYRVWSKGLKEWGVCNTCKHGHKGTCDNCAGVEGHTTEISGEGTCDNYEAHK